MPDFHDLIGNLKRFNRKERFILLNKVSGSKAFRIGPSFARCLESKVNCPVIPDDAFVAMDYHLDWLHVALDLAKGNHEHLQPNLDLTTGKVLNRCLFGGTQTDIDILIAFVHCKDTHLILIEAKADTGWRQRQLNKKGEKFCKIFGDAGKWHSNGVIPHFVLMSPEDPTDKKCFRKWPINPPHWLPLGLDPHLLKITRCDESRKQSKTGDWLRFD